MTKIEAPIISEDIWGDEPKNEYYTVRYYNRSGIGVEQEWHNVYVASEQEAKWYAQGHYRIPQCNLYCLYAFKQNSRI